MVITIAGTIGVTVTGLLVDPTGIYAAALVLEAPVNLFGVMVRSLFAKLQFVVD